MLKYREAVLDQRSAALVALRNQPMSAANVAFIKSFWPKFVEEMKITTEVYGPMKEKLDAKDPEAIAEFNEFLDRESSLPLLPADILAKADSLSPNQTDILETMLVKKPELVPVK